NYVLWTGPFKTVKTVQMAEPLLVDFADLVDDENKANHSGSKKSTVILNETKNPSYPHKDSSPTVQNDALPHSGSLKTVRVAFKRLPHSLRSFAMTDFYLSGCLK
ncbi:MAG: hypothetical protein IKN18_01515, partial [Neisseriaceae bacterium]|nr:hypothetical protein [Neisseriaceae bacterium]